jgi:dephospho-CoA kinase
VHLGLTGGIGSGKSTVAGLLAAQGACVIDADAIARAITDPLGVAIPQIVARFGTDSLNADGALDREKMRQRVFEDPKARAALEAIIHPLVGEDIARAAQAATAAGAACIVFDIPLLVESAHWRKRLHRILVVDCSEATQISRVMARNGLLHEDVVKIIGAQAKRQSRLQASDLVVCNDGITKVQLAMQVKEIGMQFGL